MTISRIAAGGVGFTDGHSANSTTGHIFTFPSSYAAVSGDMLYFFTSSDDVHTLLANSTRLAFSEVQLGAYIERVKGSDIVGATSIKIQTNSDAPCGCFVCVYRGVDLTTPEDIVPTMVANVANATTTPAIATGTRTNHKAGQVLLAGAFLRYGSSHLGTSFSAQAWTPTGPPALTVVGSAQSGNSNALDQHVDVAEMFPNDNTTTISFNETWTGTADLQTVGGVILNPAAASSNHGSGFLGMF